jgi:hypothetical protein
VRKLEEIIDRHDLDVVALHRRAERHPADSPESVYADLDHLILIPRKAAGRKDKNLAFSASAGKLTS